MAPLLISIEGNIGSGKSTLLTYMKQNLRFLGKRDVVYVDEPVAEWATITNDEGKGMLELFYANPNKYSFSFQMMAYISRLSNLQSAIRAHPNDIIIMERSLHTDYHVFAKMLREKGTLLTEEMTIYKRWFHHFSISMHGIIYLQCPPEVAMERCLLRNRPGESIDMNYIQGLHQKHESWIHDLDIRPLLVIDNTDTTLEDSLFAIEDFLCDLSEDEPSHFMERIYSSYSYSKLIAYWFIYTFMQWLKKA